MDSPTAEQFWSLIIAKTVRNALECLHAGADGVITQAAMPELNRRLRFKILQTVHCLMNLDNPRCRGAIEREANSIPSYWELPEFLPEEVRILDGGGEVAPEAIDRAAAKREQWYKTGQMPRD